MSADGKVLIETLLDTTKAEKSAKSLGGTLKSGIAKGAKVATGAMVAIGSASTATAGAMVKATKATMNYGVEVNRNSQKLNMSKQGYQEWSYVLKRSGTSIDSLRMGMKKISTQIDEARNGSKSATENFKRLGLSVDDLKGKSQEEIFGLMVKRLQGIKDTTERSAIANKFFGRSAQEMAGLLNKSGKDVEALKKQAHDLGLVLSDDAISKSAEFRGKITELQSAFEGLRNKMAVKFLPALTDVTDGLSKLVQGKEKEGLKQIQKGVNEFAKQLTKVLPTLFKVGGSVLKSLGKSIIDNLPTLLDTGAKIVVTLIRGFTKALPILIKELPKVLGTVKDALLDALGVIGKQLPAEFKPFADMLSGVIKLFSFFAGLLTSSSTAGKIFRGVIVGITGAYVAYKVATAIATTATNLLTGAMNANPIMLVVSAIGALVGILYTLDQASGSELAKIKTEQSEYEDLTNTLKENKKAREDALANSQAEAGEVDNLYKRLKELNKVEHKSKTQKEEMKEVVRELNEKLPDLKLKYDEEKDSLNKSTKEIKKNVDARKKQILTAGVQAEAESISKDLAKIDNDIADKKKRLEIISGFQTKIKDNYQGYLKQLRDEGMLNEEQYNYIVKRYKSYDELKKNENDYLTLKYTAIYAEKFLKQHIDETKQEQKKLNGQLNNTSQKLQNIQDKGTFNKLTKSAKKAGVEVPQALINAFNNGEIGIKEATDRINKAVEFKKLAKKSKSASKEAVDNIIKRFEAGEISAKKAGQLLAQAGVDGLEKDEKGTKTKTKTKKKGDDAVGGFLGSFNSKANRQKSKKTAIDFVKKFLKDFGLAGGEGSPWKTTKQKGEWAVEGFVEGIQSKQALADKAMANIATSSVSSLNRQLQASTQLSAGSLQQSVNASINLQEGVYNAVKSGFENANVEMKVGERDFARLAKRGVSA